MQLPEELRRQITEPVWYIFWDRMDQMEKIERFDPDMEANARNLEKIYKGPTIEQMIEFWKTKPLGEKLVIEPTKEDPIEQIWETTKKTLLKMYEEECKDWVKKNQPTT